MGTLKNKISQYGNLFVAVLITVGFGATFMVYGGGGQSGPSAANQDNEQRNFTAPSQNYVEGTFNRSYTEQVVIGARDDVVFVNAFYDNETQIEELRNLQQIQERFGDRVYLQIASSTQGADIVSRNGLNEFPAVVVQGGVLTQRGPGPQQEVVENVTVRGVEEAVCKTLTDLGDVAARCQQIGAL